MTNYEPSEHVRARTGVLGKGTILWRIHSSKRQATTLNPVVRPDNGSPGGGRFDSELGDYSYAYFGEDMETAIAEVLCRGLPTSSPAPRIVRNAALTARTLSRVRVTKDISTALLHGSHLTAIHQDVWLTKCSPRDYPVTRRWARSIMNGTRVSALTYRSRHDEDRLCHLVTDFSQPDGWTPPLEMEQNIDLSTPDGEALVRSILPIYNAVLMPRL